MAIPFAYTVDIKNAPACFPTLEEAVAYVTGFGAKPYKYRGNSPVNAFYSGSGHLNIPLEPYMYAATLNTGAITSGIDDDILFEQKAYNRVYKNPTDQERERASRIITNNEWLFEKNREELISGELNQRRWKWIG